MIPAAFDYKRASSAAEAISLVGEYGDDAKFLAGGHSLLPLMKLRLAQPSVLVDIGRLTDLSYIRDAGDHVAIGALTRHMDVEHSPLLAEHVPLSLKQKEYLAAEHFDFMRYSEVESVFGRAGFHALECMDLSWTTVMSQEAMLQSVRSRRSELLAQYSADFVDAFEANWLKLCDIFEHHLAYFLLIAEKARL